MNIFLVHSLCSLSCVVFEDALNPFLDMNGRVNDRNERRLILVLPFGLTSNLFDGLFHSFLSIP